MKSEPDVYSIDDLARDGKTMWDGVRNYQARNFMRDKMQAGDLVFFYHSNAEPSGIAGVAKVAGKSYPDPTAFDINSPHFDPRSGFINSANDKEARAVRGARSAKQAMPEAHRRYSATKSAEADVASTRSNTYESTSNSKKENPTWYLVDLLFVKKFKRFLSLEELKKMAGLDGMLLLQKGSRLSVQPVSEKHWNKILNSSET